MMPPMPWLLQFVAQVIDCCKFIRGYLKTIFRDRIYGDEPRGRGEVKIMRHILCDMSENFHEAAGHTHKLWPNTGF